MAVPGSSRGHNTCDRICNGNQRLTAVIVHVTVEILLRIYHYHHLSLYNIRSTAGERERPFRTRVLGLQNSSQVIAIWKPYTLLNCLMGFLTLLSFTIKLTVNYKCNFGGEFLKLSGVSPNWTPRSSVIPLDYLLRLRAWVQ